jgi:dipeptide/tripeptide permease
MILNSVYLLIFIAVLFVVVSFLAQKTEKQFIVKFGIVLIIVFSLTFFNLLLTLTNQI